MNVEETLAEREVQHGPFANHAAIEVEFKRIAARNSMHMTDIQICGLGMIFHKIARILNSGHNHSDTWHDIAGYATLVERSILDE